MGAQHIFLDRDGTLIRHVPYLHDPRQVVLLPGVAEGLRELRAGGCSLYLHTNQAGVGRGYFKLEDALACNAAMIELLGMGAELFDAICVCPEAPDQPIRYRKPSPRFAHEIMARAGLSAADLCYVGDNVSDLQTAKNVGCGGVGVNTGVHELRTRLAEEGLAQFPVFDDFASACSWLLAPSRNSHAG